MTAIWWPVTSSGSGVLKKLVTAVDASSTVRPPTAMPPIVTPSAINCGSVVVPVVPVIVVTAPADTPAAAPRPSTNRRAKPARFTGKV